VPHIRGWVGGWWGGGGGARLRLPFRHKWTSCCAKGAVNGLQITLQSKAGHLITVMDNWEQFYTNATLLKPTKHCHSLSELYRVMKKPSEKQTWLSVAILL